jgi:hypothetical protein
MISLPRHMMSLVYVFIEVSVIISFWLVEGTQLVSQEISHSDSLQQDLLCWPLRSCVVPIHYEHGDEMVWHVMN